jgi:xanthine dehydrogenase accessory factor
MDIYEAVLDLQRKRMAGALCTIIDSHGSVPRHTGSKMLVRDDGTLFGSVGGGETENRVIQEANEVIRDGKPRKLDYKLVDPNAGDPGICGGSVEVYIEPILPKPMVLIIGSGHVGKAVAHLVKWLGFKVVVSDDRPEFCTPEMVPDADEFLVCAMADIPSKIRINPQTYVILATRGVPIDSAGLPPLLETSAGYIGIIGSKRRWLTTRKNLLESGISEEKLNRIVSPIGIELKAETPEEIAVSIVAEILIIITGASGQRMTMQQPK